MQGETMNISLNEEDFKKLVRGKVVAKGLVNIALSDIGFDRMEVAIQKGREHVSGQ